MLQDDYILRQVEGLTRFLAKVLLGKDTISYHIIDDASHSDTDLLFYRLRELESSGGINEAEELLFDELESGNERYLEVALDFYSRLNELSDEELEARNFSREEILDGIKEAGKMFGIEL